MPEKKNKLALKKDGLTRVSKQLEFTNKILQKVDDILIPYRKKDKWGFCNRQKRIIIPCIYDSVTYFDSGYAEINKNGKQGTIDINGNEYFADEELKICFHKDYSYYELTVEEQNKWIKDSNSHKDIFDDRLFEKYYYFKHGNIKVKKNSYYGYLGMNLKEIIPIEYDEISYDNYIIVKKDGKYGIFNKKGIQLYPCVLDESPYNQGIFVHRELYVIKHNNKYGFINRFGKIITECIYENYIDGRSDNKCIFSVKHNGKWGIVDEKGEILECKYDKIDIFSNGVAPVCMNKKWGFIDQNGKIVVPFIYNSCDIYISHTGIPSGHISAGIFQVDIDEESYYVVPRSDESILRKYEYVSFDTINGSLSTRSSDNKWGLLDHEGKEILPCIYDEVFYYGAQKYSKNEKVSVTKVKYNGNFGLLDITGQEIIPCNYEEIGGFGVLEISKDNFIFCATVKYGGKWGIIDTYGKEILSIKYESIVFYEKGFAKVQLNGEFFYVDIHGNKVIKIEKNVEYEFLFDSTYIRMKSYNKFGLLNNNGKEIIPLKYNEILGSSKNNLFVVELNKKCGIINKDGEIVLPFNFDHIIFYDNNGDWIFFRNLSIEYIIVFFDGKMEILDKYFNKIGFTYDSEICHPFHISDWDYIVVSRNGMEGYINKSFQEIIPCIYEECRFLGGNKNYIEVKKNNKWGLVDRAGNEYWED